MKTSGGFFKDKAVVGLNTITGDRIDVAIIKVTSTTVEAPREKYLHYLVHALRYGDRGKQTKNGKPIRDYIISELTKRTHSHNWIVALKSLIVLHHCCRDAPSSELGNTLERKRTFNYMKIKNVEKSLSGSQQKLFIIQYVDYLKLLAKVLPCQVSGTDLPVEAINLTSVEGTHLLQTAEQLAEVTYRDETVDNYITLEAFRLLLKDGSNLYAHIALGLKSMLECAVTTNSPAVILDKLPLLRRATDAMSALRNFCVCLDRTTTVFRALIPDLPEPPTIESFMVEVNGGEAAFPLKDPNEKVDPNAAEERKRSVSARKKTPKVSHAVMKEEDRRAQVEDEEDKVLQQVLRLSALEAGVPYEPPGQALSKKATEATHQPPAVVSVSSRTSDHSPSTLFEGPTSKQVSLSKNAEKPPSPSFSLDDLFVDDKAKAVNPLPAPQPYSLFSSTGAPTVSSGAGSETAVSSHTGVNSAPPLTAAANQASFNNTYEGSAQFGAEGGEWDTGVPTAPLDASLCLPTVSPPFESTESWGTGVPSTVVKPHSSFPVQNQWSEGKPSVISDSTKPGSEWPPPFLANSSNNVAVRKPSQSASGESVSSFTTQPAPDSFSQNEKDPFKLLYLSSAKHNQ